MVRKAYHIREDQVIFLENLPGDKAEHIRRALDDYIEKKRKEGFKVTLSPSKGRKHG